jgi:hypothetical protein
MSQYKDTGAVKKKGFNYDEMVQEALKGVVREALNHTSKEGVPGSHHFYITFQTNRPDVIIPESLRERHPEEITIVLQHQFWDLKVDEHKFEVSLSFNDSIEKIVVPFGALISFLDPSVKFGLQFSPLEPVIEEKKGRSKSKDKNTTDNSGVGKVITLDAFRKK